MQIVKGWSRIFAMALLLSCTGKQVERASEMSLSDRPIIRCHNARTQLSEEGLLSIHLQAPLQEEFHSGDVRFLQGISITHYDIRGRRKAKLQADSAFFFQETGLYEARGRVLLKNIQTGNSLRTEKLVWNPKSKRVYTNKKVRIQHKNEIHRGEGLNASEDFKDYHILHPSGTIEVEPSTSEQYP